MEKLHFKTIGKHNINLILIHGWGTDSKIWKKITPKLTKHFKLYLIDLPGYGKNIKLENINKIEEIINILYPYIPNNTVIVGWSMGGIIATKIYLHNPTKIKGLILISTSPCFIKKKKWPGIKLKTLKLFKINLKKNYKKTINIFHNSLLLNKKSKKNNIFIKKIPKKKILELGLKIIKNIDIRNELIKINIPVLNIYGEKDNIIPKKFIHKLNKLYLNNKSIIIPNTTHAPFISKPKIICKQIIKFKNFIKKTQKIIYHK
ncbi:pimeloyl-ACP methyl ester esterase BioH [Candidatus Purcelliella pentastirinorum]|uniref:Pimeloyl-[acyl-carrier protein] methyl ester esterase n=1 Tax=Candidatus Purcelliella pentastirinorum TaxID=472834 RepID=A0AAX3N7B0_9ENTR|nr:pimeloyl-ACP methyl ester esterase BioH [Candidatus Purcelliella pentastirinorum]WDI78481.1 pimeloyl-ACP methyl ester esterase BioH [Candidatus Purcelliella pentastirinorum]WDR80490.1 pimeloyl-ACP methyl ester esterase BioH [Candidatus Purcelliella pentastirinorum]